MAQKLLMTDGQKSITLDQYPASAWTYHSGTPDQGEDVTLDRLYRRVPWLRRGVDSRAACVASMPFEVRKGDEVVDSSRDWQNVAGFLPNPWLLLEQIEKARTLENCAYLFAERNTYGITKGLRYLAPQTVMPEYIEGAGLKGFKRRINGKEKLFPAIKLDGSGEPIRDREGNTVIEPVPCPIVYFWGSDPYVEIGPGRENSPAYAALMAAGVLYHKDKFISDYFRRGAIKVTILATDSNDQAEAQRLKTWWNEVVGGVKNAWTAFVVKAKSVVPTIIGGGLDELKENGLTPQAREDIATALGVPQTRLFSNAANYATKSGDDIQYYQETIIPECKAIQAVLNEQVFGPLGYTFAFLPDTLDIFQEDEKDRADSAAALAAVMGDPIFEIVAEVLGYEIKEETMAKLRLLWAEKRQRAEVMQQQTQPQPVTESQPDEQPEDENEDERAIQTEKSKWRRKALKRGGYVDFQSDVIPPAMHAAICAGLREAKTTEEIERAFVVSAAEPLDYARLTEELHRANELLEKALQ